MNKETVYRLFGLALLIGLLVFVGQQLRHQFGISSWKLQLNSTNWIEPGLDWSSGICSSGGVAAVVGLSSHIVLILGGIAFGVAGGIIWGAIGLTISAAIQYLVARLFTDRLREQHRVRAIGGSNLKSVAE